MKKLLFLTFALFLFTATQSFAQYRANTPSLYDYSGPIVNTQTSTIQQNLASFFANRVKMSHSYSMSFGSYGGSYQNINAYTNTMQFMFSDRLQGRVDISFLHSPFGGSHLSNANNKLGGKVMIRNAELNYKIGENSFIRFQYQQLPAGYGYFGRSRFGNSFGHQQMSPWF
ncbi:MAG: hypothetical protein FH748_16835 [Balneolaceae bacterium]|nr:hypothetical protein [Balneolaceae bacterium]